MWRTRLTTRLILLNAGGTASARIGAFAAADEGLDEGGWRKAKSRAVPAPLPDRTVCSPLRCARETAAALGLDPDEEPALADSDHGRWAGRPLTDIEREEPQLLARWLADPGGGAPDGETLGQVMQRTGPWLDREMSAGGTVLAITHAAVMRAVLACTLHIPARSTFSIDIAPLSFMLLSFNRTWRLQELRPL
ncbi:Broad specificity phosphatase PhoE [Sphingobium faniae]|nr:Broad specificity phosphatase PhoE [Sphingobium faniae]